MPGFPVSWGLRGAGDPRCHPIRDLALAKPLCQRGKDPQRWDSQGGYLYASCHLLFPSRLGSGLFLQPQVPSDVILESLWLDGKLLAP